MRIVDLLNPAKILLGTSVQGKDGVIDLLVDLQDKSGCLRDREEYKTAKRSDCFPKSLLGNTLQMFPIPCALNSFVL